MNESFHIWVSHVTYEFSHDTRWWVMSRMNEACPTLKCHVMYEWVISHMNESCYTCKWVMLYMNESRHTHEWVTVYNLSCNVSICRYFLAIALREMVLAVPCNWPKKKALCQKTLDQHYASYTWNILKTHLYFWKTCSKVFFFPCLIKFFMSEQVYLLFDKMNSLL